MTSQIEQLCHDGKSQRLSCRLANAASRKSSLQLLHLKSVQFVRLDDSSSGANSMPSQGSAKAK
jgi:hypothetical protein